MAYPPPVPPTNRSDTTVAAANHASDHNAVAVALNAILAELGTDPSGTFTDVTARLAALTGAGLLTVNDGDARYETPAGAQDKANAAAGAVVAAANANALAAVAASRVTGYNDLDFPSIAPGTTASQLLTVTGAAEGDTVLLGPPANLESGLMALGRVTAADTVTVRLANVTTAAIDPAVATWRATVLK